MSVSKRPVVQLYRLEGLLLARKGRRSSEFVAQYAQLGRLVRGHSPTSRYPFPWSHSVKDLQDMMISEGLSRPLKFTPDICVMELSACRRWRARLRLDHHAQQMKPMTHDGSAKPLKVRARPLDASTLLPSSQAVAPSGFQIEFGSRFIAAASSMPGLCSLMCQYMRGGQVQRLPYHVSSARRLY